MIENLPKKVKVLHVLCQNFDDDDDFNSSDDGNGNGNDNDNKGESKDEKPLWEKYGFHMTDDMIERATNRSLVITFR